MSRFGEDMGAYAERMDKLEREAHGPYIVFCSYPSGHQSHDEYDSLAEAIVGARIKLSKFAPHIFVQIITDNYDVSYDDGPDESPNVTTGLTPEEQERVEEAGL